MKDPPIIVIKIDSEVMKEIGLGKSSILLQLVLKNSILLRILCSTRYLSTLRCKEKMLPQIKG